MEWLKRLLCFHKWEVLGVGQNWPACVNFHHLADSVHKCSKCEWQRDWIHTKPIRWNKDNFNENGEAFTPPQEQI